MIDPHDAQERWDTLSPAQQEEWRRMTLWTVYRHRVSPHAGEHRVNPVDLRDGSWSVGTKRVIYHCWDNFCVQWILIWWAAVVGRA